LVEVVEMLEKEALEPLVVGERAMDGFEMVESGEEKKLRIGEVSDSESLLRDEGIEVVDMLAASLAAGCRE